MLRPVVTLFLILAPLAALATPRTYALNRDQTDVSFLWNLGQDQIRGHVPVADARLVLDFSNLGNSTIEVTLDAQAARAGFLFANQAMRGPNMLDTARYPAITFQSEHVARALPQAETSGIVTIRGVRRPMTMTARFFRPLDRDPEDLSHLEIWLEGAVNRHDFGASGWPDMVGPEVRFEIRAVIDRVP